VDARESTYPHKIVQIKYKILFKLKKMLKIKSPDHWKVARWKENRSPKATYNKKNMRQVPREREREISLIIKYYR
jgi:hypothetical protein